MSDRQLLRIRVVLVAMAAVAVVIPMPPGVVEAVYSTRLYPVVQNLLTPLSSLVPVALFDLMVAAAGGLLVWWTVSVARAGRGRRLRSAGRMLVRITVVAAGIYLVFLAVWGLNYRRVPLTGKLSYEQGRVTANGLVELAYTTVDRLNGLHAAAHAPGWPGLAELPDQLGQSFQAVQRRLGADRVAVAGRPKPSLLTPFFRRAGVDGMISPFSLEVLVNDTVLPFERPFVVAHEWAHLAGYADESEASFVGWLVCLDGDARSRYSAWLFLFPHLAGHLTGGDRQDLWLALADGPTADLRAVSERVRDAVPLVQRTANRVYDQYLRANRVETGIASYGAVVDLVLGTAAWQTVPTADGMIWR